MHASFIILLLLSGSSARHCLTCADAPYKDVYFFGDPIQAEITSSGGQVGDLEKVGISLIFPEGALKPGEEPLKIVIRPAIGCPHQLPNGYKPASPVYFIEHRGNVNFQKNIIVHIQHWAKLKGDCDCENMDIFSSELVPSSIKGRSVFRSVYKFVKVKGRAFFSPKNSVGTVELSNICAVMSGSPEGIGILSTTSVLYHLCVVNCRKSLLCEVLPKPVPSPYLKV